MNSTARLFLVFAILIFFFFFRLGNAIRFRCPLPEINQFATLGTKRTIRVGGVVCDNLAALGTINNRSFHNYSLEKQNGCELRPVTATPLLIQTAIIGPRTFSPAYRDAIRMIWPIPPQIGLRRIGPRKTRARNREGIPKLLILNSNLIHLHPPHE